MSNTQPPNRGGPKSTFEELLASLPCVASGCKPPVDAPLTPEQVARMSEYLRSRPGPAGEAERRKS